MTRIAIRKATPEIPSMLHQPAMPSALGLRNLHRFVRPILVAVPLLGLLLGWAAYLAGAGQWSGSIWAAATIPVLG
ncbi:hypothetical protein KBI52_00175, partial [Microvirga sp. HBU67558]|nr:hypothetical protein [Microvirga sp. HBU67558]